jgi:hypothetical protein
MAAPRKVAPEFRCDPAEEVGTALIGMSGGEAAQLWSAASKISAS